MPQFYTRRGRLTPYALACGYAERVTRADKISVTLWQEHGAYHVRATDAAAHRLEWLAFTSLAAAREAFDAARRSPLLAAGLAAMEYFPSSQSPAAAASAHRKE